MFDAVFGHARIKDVLERTLTRGHLHHGLCFHGPAGIGKLLVAQQLSRAMLCEHQSGCGQCKHCHKFGGGNHPDYREIHPDGADIKVDQIREISDNLHFRPFEARVRMIVLNGVESMREGAANAFLKSLEEPPSYVFFVLVTSDLNALLPTIRSRCQKMAFQSLSDEDKANILIKRFNMDAGLAARLASISFRQLETEEQAWNQFTADSKMVLTFYKRMLDDGNALDYFSERVRDKSTFPKFHDHLLAVTRELCFVAMNRPAAPIFDEFREVMVNLARRVSPVFWRNTWESLLRLGAQRRLNLNLSLWFNSMSVHDLNLLGEEAIRLKARLNR